MNLFGVVLYVSLWSLVSADKGETYKLIAYFSLYYGVVNNLHSSKIGSWIADAINSGDLNNYLIKPVNFPLMQAIRGVTVILVRITVPTIIIIAAALIMPSVFAPLSPLNFLAFLLFTFFGLIIWDFLLISISTLAFYGTEIHSTLTVLDLVINLIKGAYIPAFYFPLWLTKGLSFTFIPYLASYPIKLYQEAIVPTEFFYSLVVALIWIGIFSMTTVYFYKQGLKRYEAAGG